jgi:hypothetical protein
VRGDDCMLVGDRSGSDQESSHQESLLREMRPAVRHSATRARRPSARLLPAVQENVRDASPRAAAPPIRGRLSPRTADDDQPERESIKPRRFSPLTSWSAIECRSRSSGAHAERHGPAGSVRLLPGGESAIVSSPGAEWMRGGTNGNQSGSASPGLSRPAVSARPVPVNPMMLHSTRGAGGLKRS